MASTELQKQDMLDKLRLAIVAAAKTVCEEQGLKSVQVVATDNDLGFRLNETVRHSH
jgi:hypothetical protein